MEKFKLDVPINELYEDADNPQTFREFIQETEEEFGLAPADLDSMSPGQLGAYIDFMDELWSK